MYTIGISKVDEVIATLQAERDRIDNALQALTGQQAATSKVVRQIVKSGRVVRGPKRATKAAAKAPTQVRTSKPLAKQAIRNIRKGATAPTKKAASKMLVIVRKAGGICPEGRARIAAAQKTRWAAVKKTAK